jgi:hypothetical protein
MSQTTQGTYYRASSYEASSEMTPMAKRPVAKDTVQILRTNGTILEQPVKNSAIKQTTAIKKGGKRTKKSRGKKSKGKKSKRMTRK